MATAGRAGPHASEWRSSRAARPGRQPRATKGSTEKTWSCQIRRDTSSGYGTTAGSEIVRERPFLIIESGPAAGVSAAARLASEMGRDAIITFDMGGTTAKASLVEHYRPDLAAELEVEVLPENPATEGQARAGQFDDGGGVRRHG